MRWSIVGTVPRADFPLVDGICRLDGDALRLEDQSIRIRRGTPALLAAACLSAELLGIDLPRAILVGDIGTGEGSKRLYEYLVKSMAFQDDHLVVFHYLQPDVDWHNRVLMTIEDQPNRPCLIADAGYMYVAKMSGFAGSYDLFTPDIGEMAFLADESAPHPFYTRGFLLHNEAEVPRLIARAYQHHNAAKYLLVKGQCDYVASDEGVIAAICEPSAPHMEPIGGTGDTLTGIVAALIEAGNEVATAAQKAAKTNRLMGAIYQPTPASSVSDLLSALPRALTTTGAEN
ncbi:MAG: NAD(P)H-hydrate dehydratase [Desulfomonilaceae bacterium]